MSEWSSFTNAVASTIKTRTVSKKLGGSFLALLYAIFAWITSSFKELFWAIFDCINHFFPLPGIKK